MIKTQLESHFLGKHVFMKKLRVLKTILGDLDFLKNYTDSAVSMTPWSRISGITDTVESTQRYH